MKVDLRIKLVRHKIIFVQLCWNLGGSLAEFKDKEEESHVSSYLNEEDYYWIGLNDPSEEGYAYLIVAIV